MLVVAFLGMVEAKGSDGLDELAMETAAVLQL